MKKIALVLLSVALLTSMGFSAVRKSADKPNMVVFGDLGLAVSDFEGLFLDAGVQYGLAEKLFGEFLVDFYLDPAGKHGNITAFGFNLNGVYKHPLQDKLNLFGKAGISMTMISGGGGSDFGLNAGGGVEYSLAENMGLRGGATFKLAFGDGATGTWFKFYGGFYYNL